MVTRMCLWAPSDKNSYTARDSVTGVIRSEDLFLTHSSTKEGFR
jgi:hypothetical protein